MKGIRRFGHMSYHEVIRCSHRSSHKVIRVLPGRMLMNREEACIKTVVMSILVSFIASAVIELSQLVTGTGIFELTDILMNTLGGTAGVICAKLMDKILRSERNE